MKQLYFVSALLCAALLIGVQVVWASGPKIHLEEEGYDFGKIKEGAEVVHEFKFKNLGDADLIITDVKTSCGCTAAVISDKTIAPSKQGAIKVTFNSGGRNGPQTKTVTIVSNDPERPNAEVRLTGKVDQGEQPLMKVEPMTLDVGVVEPGSSSSHEVTITNTGTADLVIEEFVGRSGVSVGDAGKDKKKTIKPGESMKVKVSAVPENRSGIFQGYIQIRNNSVQRIMTIPFFGYVSSRYMLKPEFQTPAPGN
ncbi:MAG: DUF1573 domain-containing protein [bacterium]